MQCPNCGHEARNSTRFCARCGRELFPNAPGWYPDPWSATGTGERYFDGKNWGSSDRPLERVAGLPSPMPRKLRRARGKARRVVGPIVVLALLVAGALALNRHSSKNSNADKAVIAATTPTPTGRTTTTTTIPE